MKQHSGRAGRAGGAAAGAAALLLGVGLAATPASALTIQVSQSVASLAGPESSAGGGTLLALARAAATVWEAALDDGGAGTVVNIEVGWADISGLGRTTTASSPPAGPGMIGQANARTVELATSVSGGWHLDPTPFDMSGEYAAVATTTTAGDGAGGSIEASRRHGGATGDAAGRFDAFTVLIHEIAHAIGFGDYGDSPFDAGVVEILQPGTGAVFEAPLVVEGGGHVQALRGDGLPDLNSPYFHSLLGPVQYAGRRVLPSQADVLVVAEIVGYQLGVSGTGVGAQLSAGSFGATAVPVPAAGGLLAAGLAALVAAGRRRRA
ncbi:hypothetical protein [Albimonas pacifica]|uniref:VPLPA-CTERM protein sorting domain-containing protein n=1 Tax=Albimonas pacifica TaxID=1114924 RepID=A0A1I3GDJ9_9RHOB|nr:hypothetical protein [Albimonas pacifica]SFI21487.1 VPLPA-CTERM protein sorting domain-containing protein [Albimonas pacifica]